MNVPQIRSIVLTRDALQSCLPARNVSQPLFNAVSAMSNKYDLNTNRRMAAFIAICEHESGFTTNRESLNYSAVALRATFGNRITNAQAAELGRPSGSSTPVTIDNQKKIANIVYGGRFHNVPGSDDGWNFRGGGWNQTTFRANYEAWGRSFAPLRSAEDAANFISTVDGAADSSGFYFQNRSGMLSAADEGDFHTVFVLNAGNGATEEMFQVRLKTYSLCLSVL